MSLERTRYRPCVGRDALPGGAAGLLWDDQTSRNLRLFVSVDDGHWRALVPLSGGFIKASDGSFVGDKEPACASFPGMSLEPNRLEKKLLTT